MSVVAFIRRCLEAGMPLGDALTAGEIFEDAVSEILDERRAKDRARQARRRNLMPDNWNELRVAAFQRDSFTCTYCGEATEEPHCDHIIPLARGGANDLANLTTACRDCNTSKGARTPEEWRRAQ